MRMLHDAWGKRLGFDLSDADENGIVKASFRVATLDVWNRNNRRLKSGVMGGDTTWVGMSDWEHSSIRAPGGFLSVSGTRPPINQGVLSEQGDHMNVALDFNTTKDDEAKQVRSLELIDKVVGFSVGYWPTKVERVVIPKKKIKGADIAAADFVEFTPTMTPASPGTFIKSMDDINIDELDFFLDMVSDEALAEALARRDRNSKSTETKVDKTEAYYQAIKARVQMA